MVKNLFTCNESEGEKGTGDRLLFKQKNQNGKTVC